MTITIDISSDIDKALRDVGDTFERQIPFAMVGAITDTAFDVRRRVVGSTYPNAFDVKNTRFANVLFNITKDGETKWGGMRVLKRELNATGSTEIDVRQVPLPSRGGGSPDREYIERHATGGSSAPRSSAFAVPKQKFQSQLRGKSGQILKRNKPMNITNKKKYFVKEKGGRKVAIMERNGKDITAVYLLLNNPVPIPKRFRFYEDAEDTTLRVFPGHFDNRFARAIRTSRFVPT